TMSRQSAEVSATLPATNRADMDGPQIDILNPTDQEWSRFPRIVGHYADSSGIDQSSLQVSFDQPLGAGARAAAANLVDLAYRKDEGMFLAFLEPPLSLPRDQIATLTVRLADKAGRTSTKSV